MKNYDDYNELFDATRAAVDDAIAAVFEKLQNDFGGFYGDCPPDVEWDLENLKDSLSELIAHTAHDNLTNRYQKGVNTMNDYIIIIHNMQVIETDDENTITFRDKDTEHTEPILEDDNGYYFNYKGKKRYLEDIVKIWKTAGKYYERAIANLPLGDDEGV